MNVVKKTIACVGAFLLAATLGSCGQGAAPEEVANYAVEFQQPFTGREARDASELEAIVQESLETAREREGKKKSDAEETKQAKRVNGRFTRANASYTKGNYAKAQQRYEAILEIYPGHYGANVNLTLALLQQEQADEALKQALACCHIFHEEPEPLLNAQVAGAACGFSAADVEGAIDEVLQDAGTSLTTLRGKLKDEYENYYQYNNLWDRIETELHVQAEEGDGEDADASAPAKPDYQAFVVLGVDLSGLEGKLPNDTDMAALAAYYHTVGLQLGFEADPSLIEPVHTMPYIAVDSDLCTIRVVEITNNEPGEERGLLLEVTNKTEDTTLSLGSIHTWLVNGGDAMAHLDEASIPHGEMQEVNLQLGYSGEDDLASLAGTIQVNSVEQDSMLAIYPISWEAAEGE